MKVLFLDESGDHNLSVIDSSYPLFVLGGVIMEKDYAETVLQETVDCLKVDLFGNRDIILHAADITRNRNGFERMKDESFRHRFYAALNSMMTAMEYTVVACAIRKDEHLAKYGLAALDPYLLSLNVLVECFCLEIGAIQNSGVIVAERRGNLLDRELDVAWLNLKVKGTRYVGAREIDNRITGLNLRSKSENIAGLQLADLVLSPIGRHVLGKSAKPDWTIVEARLRRNRLGEYLGVGLVVLPKETGPTPATQWPAHTKSIS